MYWYSLLDVFCSAYASAQDITSGDYESARDRLQTALRLAEEGQHGELIAEAYYHMGMADEALKEMAPAVEVRLQGK